MSGPPENVWTCRNCTLINEQTVNTCVACDCPKPNPEEPFSPRKFLDKAQGFFSGIPDQISSAVNTVQNLVSSSPESSPPRSSANFHSAPTTSSPPPEIIQSNDMNMQSSEWTCGRCTYINGAGAKQCNMCGAPERFKTSFPKEENPPASTIDSITITDEDEGAIEIFCDSCGYPYTTDENKACPICSFADNNDNVVEIASTPQPESQPLQEQTAVTTPVESPKPSLTGIKWPPPVKPRSDSEWTCSKCTFVNKSNDGKCNICKRQKEKNRETWICKHCSFENSLTSLSCSVCKINRTGENKEEEMKRYSVEKEKSMTMEWRRQQDAKEANETFKRIRSICQGHALPFVDDSFQPAPSSLFGTTPGTQLAGKVDKWLRPSELHEHKDNPTTPWKVFRLPVSPADISQGLLGDCWFLSALSVLAEKPELLEQIMITKEINSEGAYQVRLCNDGRWQTILIDDLLPATNHGLLVCSKAKRKQLWVPLIEKALAKMNGSYEALISGRCWEGLATLTGASCETVKLQSSEENSVNESLIWATILSSKEAGFLMGASCGGGNMKVDEQLYQSLGLRRRHSYSVLDVQDICGNRLLRLRNPWGRFSWNGDWSDNSSKWTPALRDALGAHEARGGVFWISLADILKYFDTIDISKLHPGWSEVRVDGSFPASASDPCKVTVVTLDRPTEVDFTLYQTWRKSEKLTDVPSDLLIMVVRANGDQVIGEPRVVAFARRQLRAFVSCSAMLEPGDYIVLCCSFNNLKLNQQYTGVTLLPYVVAMHSSRPLMYTSAMRPYSLIAQTIIALAVQKGNRHEGREGVTCYYLSKGWSGAIIVVENRYPDHHLHVRCDCNGSFNVVSSRGTLVVADSIPPLHRQIVIILSQCVETGYSIRHHIVNRMSPRPDLKDWGPPRAKHVPELHEEVFALHSPQPL
ncbi:calpain-15-like [Apostichopus japonicus]|uniref:calpain-15-like n=1 Tax=Stichopus japonicus TaxID=307972 RepID=UPI003AB5DE81